jgi:hypothetical protein
MDNQFHPHSQSQTKALFRVRARNSLAFISLFFMGEIFSGCGYTLQGSQNILYTKAGIRTVFIAPILNNTYKSGVDNIVYNNLLRVVSSYGRVRLVSRESDADATLRGIVSLATYAGTAGSQVSQLNPKGVGGNLISKDFVISTEYTANLTCSFMLTRNNPRPGQKVELWSSLFTRSKPFPAANQLDVPGTTSALINESEFDRALTDLARSMMDDVHESMLAMF